MHRSVITLLLFFQIPSPLAHTQPLTDQQIQQAIDLGLRYKSRDKLWSKEFRKTNDFYGRSGNWQARLSLLPPSAQIAAAASTAAHEFRTFTIADARSLPALGDLVAVLEVADGGWFRHNTTREVHMVMDVNGQIIQPDTKEQMNSGWVAGYWNTVTTYVSMRFTYPAPSNGAATRFIFVGADGKEHPIKVDLARLR